MRLLNSTIPIEPSTLIDKFNREYLYYKENNITEFVLSKHVIKSLYQNLNIQLVFTNHCYKKCAFCIEDHNPRARSKQEYFTNYSRH